MARPPRAPPSALLAATARSTAEEKDGAPALSGRNRVLRKKKRRRGGAAASPDKDERLFLFLEILDVLTLPRLLPLQGHLAVGVRVRAPPVRGSRRHVLGSRAILSLPVHFLFAPFP